MVINLHAREFGLRHLHDQVTPAWLTEHSINRPREVLPWKAREILSELRDVQGPDACSPASNTRARNSVPAVRLHQIARLPLDQRRRRHRAFMAGRPDQAIIAIGSRTGP